LELSLKAVDQIQQERHRLDQHWQQRLQRAGYEAREAERRYRAVDPENRLVARTLEQGWEQALKDVRQVEEDYHRFQSTQPAPLSNSDRNRIQALAADIQGLWQSPTTTIQDRKEIIRLLVERVVVHVDKNSEYVDVTIHWHGGFISQHEIVRRVSKFEKLRDYDRLMERLLQLRRAGKTSAQIAEILNEEGFRTPRQGRFYKQLVRKLLSRRGLANEKTAPDVLALHDWWLPDLAKQIPVSPVTLRCWARWGWLHAHQTPAQGMWVVWANHKEIRRLRQLATLSHRGAKHYPRELTRPSKR
jgi:hypothetical protein